jgi:uncharacterized protein with ACT and thioredoxin-like domain
MTSPMYSDHRDELLVRLKTLVRRQGVWMDETSIKYYGYRSAVAGKSARIENIALAAIDGYFHADIIGKGILRVLDTYEGVYVGELNEAVVLPVLRRAMILDDLADV